MTLDTTRIINEGIEMIEEGFGQKMPRDSLAYTRLMSHLYYMIARTRRGESTNVDFNDFIFSNYPKTGEAARSVCRVHGKGTEKTCGKGRNRISGDPYPESDLTGNSLRKRMVRAVTMGQSGTKENRDLQLCKERKSSILLK